jgi:hypothetical protein
MPISDKYKLIFVHIPKTAGTSIEKMIEIRNNKLDLWSTSIPILQHLVPKDLKKYIDDNKWNTYYKFTVVRNPFDRLVSDYKWMLTQNLFKKKQTFNEFVKLVENVVINNQYHNHELYDHFKPQYLYFEDIEYDYICKFETLVEDIKVIQKASNNNNKLPYLNKTKHDNYKIYYNTETKNIVEKLYYKDLEKFNYKF